MLFETNDDNCYKFCTNLMFIIVFNLAVNKSTCVVILSQHLELYREWFKPIFMDYLLSHFCVNIS